VLYTRSLCSPAKARLPQEAVHETVVIVIAITATVY
jgi:hypothetical protein